MKETKIQGKAERFFEWLLCSLSIAAITISFFACGNTQYHYLIGSLIGVTSLMFLAKGNPIGQILTIVFSVFYGIISYSYAYYGEMITYLAMTAPMAAVALVSWLRNPYGKAEVKVNVISVRERVFFVIITVAVTVAFYFILRALNTANLIISTVSVATSFSASYLTARRSRFYAIFYGLNDVVLITMWSLACVQSLTYLPMAICFSAFFALDLYAFYNWSAMKRRQSGTGGEGNGE